MIAPLFALAIIAGAPNAQTRNWVVAGTASDRATMVLVDRASVQASSSSRRTFWSLYVAREGSEDYDYSVRRDEVDCNARTLRSSHVATYAIDGTRPLTSTSYSTYQWPLAIVLPESLGEGVMETVCRGDGEDLGHNSASEMALIAQSVLGALD